MGYREQREDKLKRTIAVPGLFRTANWIDMEVRTPDDEGDYVCINDKGEYTIFNYMEGMEFPEWIIAWLEEIV